MSDRAVDAFDMPAEPSLADVARVLERAIVLGIRTHLPAKVLTYNPATQTASIEVGFLQVVKVQDPTKLPKRMLMMRGVPPNAEAVMQPLIVDDIPVAWMRTQQGYLTFPIGPGDTGTLHVHDRSLARWKLVGTAGDPGLAFTHALADSEFCPGLHPTTAPIAPPTDMTATVVDGAQVKIGRNAVDAIAMATKVQVLFDTLKAAITGWTPVANDGGAALKAALTSWLLGSSDVAALKGKVE